MIEPSDTERSELPDCTFFYLQELEVEVERLESFINDLLDPKTNWPLERIQAHLDRIDEWQEGKQDG